MRWTQQCKTRFFNRWDFFLCAMWKWVKNILMPSHYWLRLVAKKSASYCLKLLIKVELSLLTSNRLHLRKLQVTFFPLALYAFFVSLCKKSWKIIYLLFKCARARERERERKRLCWWWKKENLSRKKNVMQCEWENCRMKSTILRKFSEILAIN